MEPDETQDQAPPEPEAGQNDGQPGGQSRDEAGNQPLAESPTPSDPTPEPAAEAPARASESGEPAPEAPEAVAAAQQAVDALEARVAAFLASVRRLLDRRQISADVGVRVVRHDADGRGGLLAFDARSLAEARTAAGMAVQSGDGREWTHAGSGPNLTTDRFHAYVHVSPLG